jgi:multiple sugar transport system permease protein
MKRYKMEAASMNISYAPATKPRKRGMSKSERRENLKGYAFISPYLIGFCCFVALPLFFSLYSSFTYYDITSTQKWIGWKNYINIFTKDTNFIKSLENTFYYVVFSVPLVIILAMVLALLMNMKIRFMQVFRTAYYLPSVLSGVAVYLLWQWIFDPSNGLLNNVLALIGVHGPAWLFDPSFTKAALIVMRLWSIGGTMILLLAALQSVPADLYDAGAIDGVTGFKRFIYITLPMISPTMLFVMITGINGAFQIFDSAYIMSTNGTGDPGKSLLFYNLNLYNIAIKEYRMGYACALAWILFVIILFFTLIQLYVSRKWVYYEGGDNK